MEEKPKHFFTEDNNPTFDWQERFKQEFGIHFKDSPGELQFALTFIEEEIAKARKEPYTGFHCLKCNAFKLTGICVPCYNRAFNKLKK